MNEDYLKEYKDIENQGGTHQPLPQYNKWGPGEWFDPNLSFEELYELVYQEISKLKTGDFLKKEIKEDAKFLLVHKLGGTYNCVYPSWKSVLDEEGHLKNEIISLNINFGYPESEIIDQVGRWILEFKMRLKKEKLPWDWDKLPIYHKVITLNKQGKSAEEIAEIMFPKPDPFSEDESIPDLQADSLIRTVYRYIKIGKAIIQGGYKKIK